MAKVKLDEFFAKLEASGLDAKKPEKRVKTITDLVKSTFLANYNPIINFGEIFASRFYNSVNASALYAMVLDRLKIPFAVQETPTHVSVIAYPEQQKIIIETTAPAFNYRIYDAKYQEAFVDDLKNAHLIGDAEASAFTTEGLFNRHFYASRNLTLAELIGLHYLNDAYEKSDKNDYAGAFKQCEKSYMFFPSKRCAFMLTNLAALTLQNQKMPPRERALYIAKVSRYQDYGITAEMIQGEFAKLNEEVLIRENNRTLYRECADIIVNQGLQDEEVRNGVRYIQYYELGRADYNQGRYSNAKYYFAKALEIQPNNAELSATFMGSLANSTRNMRDASLLDTVLVYRTKFPTLSQNNNFNAFTANAYLVASATAMDGNNIKLAEEHLAEFEKLYGQDKSMLTDPNQIGDAYSKICTHYFKKGQKEKARSILKKGLEIAPDNYQLRIRQQVLN